MGIMIVSNVMMIIWIKKMIKKNDTEKKDIYWCSECQCFSTYKHNHPVEMPEDAEESIQEDDTDQEEYYEGKE